MLHPITIRYIRSDTGEVMRAQTLSGPDEEIELDMGLDTLDPFAVEVESADGSIGRCESKQ